MGSDNGVVQIGFRPLPEPVLTDLHNKTKHITKDQLINKATNVRPIFLFETSGAEARIFCESELNIIVVNALPAGTVRSSSVNILLTE